MANIKKPYVFLCHAREDKPAVRRFYNRLKKDGFDAWIDEEKLLPGQDWQLEISKAVKNSNAVIVFLSSQSIEKEGYVQKEIRLALDIAKEKPEGMIYFIPARLDECTVPDSLHTYQWVNLFEEKGYEKIKQALRTRFDLAETKEFFQSDKTEIVKSESAQVTIIIERDILTFTDKEKDGFVYAISKLTGVSSNQIRILQVAEGSVILTLEMPVTGANRLMELYRANDVEIEKLHISKITILLNIEADGATSEKLEQIYDFFKDPKRYPLPTFQPDTFNIHEIWDSLAGIFRDSGIEATRTALDGKTFIRNINLRRIIFSKQHNLIVIEIDKSEFPQGLDLQDSNIVHYISQSFGFQVQIMDIQNKVYFYFHLPETYAMKDFSKEVIFVDDFDFLEESKKESKAERHPTKRALDGGDSAAS